MKKAYYIEDQDGLRWAHNRWATTESIPDFYHSKLGARTQIQKGKISIMMKYDEALKPVIREANIQFEENA